MGSKLLIHKIVIYLPRLIFHIFTSSFKNPGINLLINIKNPEPKCPLIPKSTRNLIGKDREDNKTRPKALSL